MWHRIHLEALSKLDEEKAKALLAWQKLVPPHVGFRCLNLGAIKHGEGYRSAFSLVLACEKAVDLGAKHIRIMGADMNGEWQDEPHPGPHGEREIWDRWAFEREQVAEMIREAEKIGVEIELAHN